MKENAIRNYLSQIDFKRDNWSYRTIESDMQKFLGETPGVDVKYEKDVMVNETTGISKEYSKIVKVSVVYTDTDNKIKKLEVLVGEL